VAQPFEDMPAALREFIQQEDAVVDQGHLPWQRHLPAADQSHIRDGVMEVRHGRVVTNAVRSPVRPATRWRRVVSRASARVSAGTRG
jgi:hypothetical protein